MSQEEFGDDSVYINNLFDKETKQSDRSVLIDMTKLSRSKTINADELNSQMARKVQKITAIFPQMQATQARSLLMKYRWDVNRALESAYDTEFTDENDSDNSNSATIPIQTQPKSCEICLENGNDVAIIEVVPCRHKACFDCLGQHISIFVGESSGLPRNAVTCPGFKCSTEISDEVVYRLIASQSDLKSKYLSMIANAYVQSNVYIKWCPRSGCTNAVKINECVMETHSSVRCNCRFWFCFTCQEPYHEPISCENYKLWITITSEEAQSQKWILENSKKCPNATCRVDIQKNGGCTHMTCRNCKHEFCWICMGKWGGRHTCDAQAATNGAGDSNTKYLSRLQHFNSHYQAMLESLKKDEKFFNDQLKPSIPSEIELPHGFLKTDFVDNAFEILNLCRRTLMFSYAFSYYMTTIDNQIFVFEEKLTNLEQCTAKLAEKLRKVKVNNLKEIKAELTDLALVNVKCRKYILENIREGHDRKWWRKFPISMDNFEPIDDSDFEYDPADFL